MTSAIAAPIHDLFLHCAPSVVYRSKFVLNVHADVQFLTGRLPLDGECLSASSPLWLLETEIVAALRVPETMILVVAQCR